jgi:hypothetical protein
MKRVNNTGLDRAVCGMDAPDSGWQLPRHVNHGRLSKALRRADLQRRSGERCGARSLPAGGTVRFELINGRIFGGLKARPRAGFVYRSFSAMNDIDCNGSVDTWAPCWTKVLGKNTKSILNVLSYHILLLSE